MRFDLTGRYIALLYAFGVLVGVAVIFGGTQVPNQEWSNGLVALGVTISATSGVTWLYRWLGPEEGSSAADVGVPGVKVHRQAERSFYEKLRQARTVDLLYNTGRTLIIDYRNDIQDALRKSCQIRMIIIRMIISSPRNACIQDEDAQYSLGRVVDLRSEISAATGTLREIVETLRSQHGATGKLEARYTLAVPMCSMVFVDGELLRVTPYLPYGAGSWSCPCLDVVEPRNAELFRFYEALFERVWSDSEKNTFIKADFRYSGDNDVLPPR